MLSDIKRRVTLPIFGWKVDMKMSVRTRCCVGEEEEMMEMEKKDSFHFLREITVVSEASKFVMRKIKFNEGNYINIYFYFVRS